MLFAMPEIVFQVVALGFQGIVILVLNLPPSTPCFDYGGNIFGSDRNVGDEGILVQNFACGFMRNDQFAPVDLNCVAAIPQRDLVDEAVAPDFAVFSVPTTLDERGDSRVLLQPVNPLVQTSM